ncbi:MAG: hypothetical protein ACK5TE_16605, partial [Pseudomonadota bacterium]
MVDAEQRGDILLLARQPDDIHVVSPLDVAPEQRELRHSPCPKRLYVQEPSERRRADDRFELDRIERSVGRVHRHADATVLAGVPGLALLIAQRLEAQNRRIQSISPRAIDSSSFSSALVRRRPG